MHPSAIAVQGTGPSTAYVEFRAAVARAQVTHWLTGLGTDPPATTVSSGPTVSSRQTVSSRPTVSSGATVIDISGPATNAAQLAADSGHRVLKVLPADQRGASALPALPRREWEDARSPARDSKRGKSPLLVAGDEFGLQFVADGCADGVIAEDGTLSRNLAAEGLVSEIARVLRPGGRVLACVDNQTLGMAALAQQSAWPNLCDLPHADVLLVPWPDGTITRCYASEQLRELFTAAGFDVSWIRPRTVFAPRAVSYLLARDPHSFPKLLSAELRARSDDSVGDQLVISARKR